MDIGRLFSLQGRIALITGGSKNIGKHIAEGFIAAGAERVYITSRKPQACEETAAELGPKCIPLPMDVSSVEACKALGIRSGCFRQDLECNVAMSFESRAR